MRRAKYALREAALLAVTLAALIALGARSGEAQMQDTQPDARPSIAMVPLPKMPQVSVQALPGYGMAPLTVGFLLNMPDPSVQFESFRWDFGDGQVSILPPLMLFHTYTRPGTYVVTVTAITTDGMSATALAGVTVTGAAH